MNKKYTNWKPTNKYEFKRTMDRCEPVLVQKWERDVVRMPLCTNNNVVEFIGTQVEWREVEAVEAMA